MPEYGSASYWDERYSSRNTESFDWYINYDNMREQLLPFLSKDASFEVLIPGCGNSCLAEDLHADGFKNITCIDNSKVVIQQMAERYNALESVDWISADALSLELIPDGCFDCVIDKAVADAILCGDSSFNRISKYVDEMYRVLKPGGVYLLVSHGIPSTRKSHLESEIRSWNVSHIPIKKTPLGGYDSSNDASDCHYLYVCEKH